MDWLRSEDLKEEKNVTAPAVIVAGTICSPVVTNRRSRSGRRVLCRQCVTDHSASNLDSDRIGHYLQKMKRTLGLSIAGGFALALIFWLSLEVSDVLFQSRLLPWDLPLIYAQDMGFRAAARLFPCQREGFDTGCEAYKALPAFLGANALAYCAALIPIVHLWRRKITASTKRTTQPPIDGQ